MPLQQIISLPQTFKKKTNLNNSNLFIYYILNANYNWRQTKSHFYYLIKTQISCLKRISGGGTRGRSANGPRLHAELSRHAIPLHGPVRTQQRRASRIPTLHNWFATPSRGRPKGTALKIVQKYKSTIVKQGLNWKKQQHYLKLNPKPIPNPEPKPNPELNPKTNPKPNLKPNPKPHPESNPNLTLNLTLHLNRLKAMQLKKCF